MENINSLSSTTIPDVYIFDYDNEAESYWQMMVEFLSINLLVISHY